ncbi:MAG: LysM peptidoglycan-binding domain-containing protein [Draconibacterium sp.]|nr:LysM peptidoglycan-binding domain-containing protein [Draconibacterium sp.]
MKFFRSVIILLFSVFIFNCLNAQDLKENELIVIKGEKYVLHQVRTGETIYSISRDFKVGRSVLIQNNPKISDGLNIGEILKIPYRNDASLTQIPAFQKGDPTRFEFHKIKSRKETPYFIAKKYGITVEEIYAYNPEVRKFRRGKKIRIPVWERFEKPVVEEPNQTVQPKNLGNEIQVHTVLSGETLYSISKKYDVAESEILFYNPEAKNLKAGSKINIPVKSLEVATVVEPEKKSANVNYFEHIIESGETMWGTTRKYGVSEEVLKELNPALRTGFPAGVVIKIPVKNKIEVTQAKPVNDDAFLKHLVKPGETLYGLAAIYNLNIPEIKKYNPILENRNLVIGETILIPKEINKEILQYEVENEVDSIQQLEAFYKVELPVEIPEPCKQNEFSTFSNKTYDVALFLPLYLEANDTLNRETMNVVPVDSLSQIETELVQDTTIEKVGPKELFKEFYRNSESFVQFYEGVLLAVDSLQKSGMQINLNVFDTQRNMDSIRAFIFSDEFLETDLIIGPIYQNVQKEVAQIAAKNRIPIVSPLESESNIINSNPQYFQVTPSRNYIAEKTAEMIAEEYFNSNFIVVRTAAYVGTPEGKLVELIQEKLFNSGFLSKRNGVNFTVYDFKNEGPAGLRRIMSHRKENVVYIPSTDEGELSVAISNVNNLADDYSITLIGSNRFQNYKSIDVEQFHNLKLRYIAPYWIDYKNPVAIGFIEKFKSNFGTEPSSIGVQGYDVAFYFLKALKYFGNNFEDCLPYFHLNLVQGNYHFEKVSQFGGYMNQGVSVISYSRDYEVTRNRILGQPKLVDNF